LARVIKLESSGKARTQLTRAIVLALRELARQQNTDNHTRDLAAFIALALEAITATIDPSVEAWEKRGYWLKADRFRMEWAWAGPLSQIMRKAILEDDWSRVAITSAQIAGKLSKVEVPQRHRLGEPWIGAWERLLGSKSTASRSGSKNLSS
jgi:hypothetical protein